MVRKPYKMFKEENSYNAWPIWNVKQYIKKEGGFCPKGSLT